MANTYELQDAKTSPKGGVTAELIENGIIIAKVTRPAKSEGWVFPFQAKFLSERSKYRFSDYCDSLSFSEVIEILYTNAQATQKA